MIDLKPLENRLYYVVGLARSGLATLQALDAAGIKAYAYDDSMASEDLGLSGLIEWCAPKDVPWQDIDALILSPGIPHTYPQPHEAADFARQNGVPIVCDVNLLAQLYAENVFIGVTGTNGKSTTTALIHHFLPGLLMAGNNGTPVMSLKAPKDDAAFLLELSSYQLERVPYLKCDVAVLLNLQEDHINRHGDFNGYISAKKNLILSKGVMQTVVLGVDTPETLAIYNEIKSDAAKQVIAVSTTRVLDEGISIVDGVVFENAMEIRILKKDLPLQGRHNHENIAATYAVLRALNHDFDFERLEAFKGLPHRQEIIFKSDGLVVINDSKATNIESTLSFLGSLDAQYSPDVKVHLLLGGVAKKTGLEGLEKYKDRIAALYLYGESQELFSNFCDRNNIPFDIYDFFKSAVQESLQAALSTKGKSIVALSPACASFDMFKDFEGRGNVFRDLVKVQVGESS